MKCIGGPLPRVKLRNEAEGLQQRGLLAQQIQMMNGEEEEVRRASLEEERKEPARAPAPPAVINLDVSKVTDVLDEEGSVPDGEEPSNDSDSGSDSDSVPPSAVDKSTIPIPTELIPAVTTKLSKKSSISSSSSAPSPSKKKDSKKERLRRRKEAQKRAKVAASESADSSDSWIRALFNQIDTDADGHITVSEMRAYAKKLNLPRHFMHDFELFAVGHPTVGSKHGAEDSITAPIVSGATKVDFDSFLMALHQKDNMLMRACMQGAGDGGSSLLEEVQERGVWLVCLLVLQSASGVVLQRYEAMLSRHVIITVFLTMLVGAGGNAGNQSAIKIIEGIAIGEIALDVSTFLAHMTRELTVGVLLAMVVGTGGFVRAYVTHGFRQGTEGLQNVMAVTICLAAIVLVAAMVGTALPFALGAMDMDPAHAGTVVQVVMDVIGVIVTCAVCEVALRDQHGNNSGTLARALSWLAKNAVAVNGSGGDGGVGNIGGGGSGSSVSGDSGGSQKPTRRGDGGAPIL